MGVKLHLFLQCIDLGSKTIYELVINIVWGLHIHETFRHVVTLCINALEIVICHACLFDTDYSNTPRL